MALFITKQNKRSFFQKYVIFVCRSQDLHTTAQGTGTLLNRYQFSFVVRKRKKNYLFLSEPFFLSRQPVLSKKICISYLLYWMLLLGTALTVSYMTAVAPSCRDIYFSLYYSIYSTVSTKQRLISGWHC